MIPPRRRRTKCRVDSCQVGTKQPVSQSCLRYKSTPQKDSSRNFRNSSVLSILHCACGTNLLDVVVGQSSAILELFASKDQSLLVRGNTLLVLDLGLDIVDRIGGLDLKGNGLARQGLHKTALLRQYESVMVEEIQTWRHRKFELTSALLKYVSTFQYAHMA